MSDTATADPVVPAGTVAPSANGAQPNVAVDANKPKERMFEVTLPGGKKEQWPESKVLERAQKAEGAEQAFKKASDLEKAFANLVSQGQDPKTLLSLLSNPNAFKYDDVKQEALLNAMLDSKNPKLIEAAKKWIYRNEVEPTTLTEEQRKLRELESWKAQQEEETKKREEGLKTAAEQEAVKKAWDKYRVAIGETIKTNGFPETSGMVRRIVQEARIYTLQGQQPDLAECAKAVKEKWNLEMVELLGKATPEQIISMLPDEIVKKINTAYISKLKGSQPAEENTTGEPTPQRRTLTKSSDKKTKENKEYWKNIGRR